MVKIERTFPAPKSLEEESVKTYGNYEKEDVVQQLRKDFHNKCYICEMKDLQDPQVEHLLPHKNRKHRERVFDWENLFWSCGHCNGVKNKAKYDEGILDCCKTDPEERVSFMLKGEDVQVCAKFPEDEEASLTANLVHEVFTTCNTGMRVYKSQMRLEKLQEEMNILYDRLETLRQTPDSKRNLRTLKALLRRESQFAAFKRGYVREHIDQFPKLRDYIK